MELSFGTSLLSKTNGKEIKLDLIDFKSDGRSANILMIGDNILNKRIDIFKKIEQIKDYYSSNKIIVIANSYTDVYEPYKQYIDKLIYTNELLSTKETFKNYKDRLSRDICHSKSMIWLFIDIHSYEILEQMSQFIDELYTYSETYNLAIINSTEIRKTKELISKSNIFEIFSLSRDTMIDLGDSALANIGISNFKMTKLIEKLDNTEKILNVYGHKILLENKRKTEVDNKDA